MAGLPEIAPFSNDLLLGLPNLIAHVLFWLVGWWAIPAGIIYTFINFLKWIERRERKPKPKPTPLPPKSLTHAEVDAFIMGIIGARSDLPWLRSFVKTFPPTAAMLDRLRTFLISFLDHLDNSITNTSPFVTNNTNYIFRILLDMPTPTGKAGDTYYPTHPTFSILEHLFSKEYPPSLSYTDKKRFEHTQIVGSSGAGKTNLLSHLILFDLKRDDPPGIILIDPKRMQIEKLSKLAIFNDKLKDRLIIVRPEDSPAINIFDSTGRGSVGAADSLIYLCSALASAFTDRQEGLAINLARLLLVFPQTLHTNATFYDLRDLMVDKFPTNLTES
jgi:hypothetical protein